MIYLTSHCIIIWHKAVLWWESHPNQNSCVAGAKILDPVGIALMGCLSHQAVNLVLQAGGRSEDAVVESHELTKWFPPGGYCFIYYLRAGRDTMGWWEGRSSLWSIPGRMVQFIIHRYLRRYILSILFNLSFYSSFILFFLLFLTFKFFFYLFIFMNFILFFLFIPFELWLLYLDRG